MNRERFAPKRIGAVSYLNSKPLIEGLARLVPQAELVLDVPSRLADRLAAGELDVALVPSFECLRDTDYEIVSDACVAARGPVLSVKLYSHVPIGDIQSLALDEGSRTSSALVQVILAEQFGVFPDTESLPLGSRPADARTDAVLVIGDRAMHAPAETFSVTWDLGAEWYDWTGLPFVFAVWATRAGVDLGGIEDALSLARDRGVTNLAAIARREAPRLEIPFETAREYLVGNLRFHLHSAERNGLRLFQELSIRLGLAPEGFQLVFRNFSPA